MEFSLMTEPQTGGTYDDLLEAAMWCERNGLTGFARSDHYYWSEEDPADATDAFATLAGLARDTERIRLCVMVTPITFRHPAVIAKMAASIDQMSGGRFDLGVGTGWNELEHDVFGLPFPSRSERFDRLVESIRYLSTAFADGKSAYEGEHYRLAADVLPKPKGIHIIVGGSGAKKTPTLAGAHAGEYNTFLDKPENASPKIEVMRRSAEESGRDPDAIRVSMMGPVLAAPDQASYRALAEQEAASRDTTVAELESKLADRGMPFGTPDQLGESFAALADIGVQRIYLQQLDITQRERRDETWAAIQAM